MELPAKISYAVRASIELAKQYPQKKPVPLSALCQNQSIPNTFLIQLLLRLKNAGLVKTVRGSSGGYSLARSPGLISLADVFRAIDERFIQGLSENSSLHTEAQRVLFTIWKEMNDDLAVRLENITLEEILFRIERKQVTYSI